MRKLLITIIMLTILIVGCSIPVAQVAPTVQAQVTEVEQVVAATETIAPTSTPQAPTPNTQAEPVKIAWFHMVDTSNGWAWAMEKDTPNRLVRTEDGGVTWKIVTPPGLATEVGNVFLDSQNAWVAATNDAGDWMLLHTSDGGTNWEILPTVEAIKYSHIQFFTPLEGIAVIADGAAGSVYYTVYETTDGGHEWSLIPFLPPTAGENLPEGTLHLCNICGDQFYYDGVRTIIVKGDMAYDPTGKFQIFTSFDRGLSWSTADIALPANYASGNVTPLKPMFNMSKGTLPINVIKLGQSQPEMSMLLVYRTQDGGITWDLAPVQLNIVGMYADPIHYATINDFFFQCGNGLCYTNEAGSTFVSNPVPFNLGDIKGDILTLDQYQFLDGSSGFAITKMGDNYQFWRTSDSGLNFEEIRPVLTGQ